MAKKTSLILAALSLSLFVAFGSPISVDAGVCDQTNDCACYPQGDPNVCGEDQSGPCETNTCPCIIPDGCSDPCYDDPDPCCGSDDECCGSEDPCCGSEDPCCGSDDTCCGLEGQELVCCRDPQDPNCGGGGDCKGVPKPDGEHWECCSGNSETGNGGGWCDTSSGSHCMTRNVCTNTGNNQRSSWGVCAGEDEVCAISIVNSCDDDSDCCNICDTEAWCYDENACGGGDTTVCAYDFSYEGTVGCDGVTRPLGGGTVSLTDVFAGQVACPDASQYQAAAQIAIAQALQNAGHPPDSNGDGVCDCAPGTIECDGQCIPDTEECCPDGSLPDPEFGCTVCGPGEVDCNGACIPDTETCCPEGTYPDPVTKECVACGTNQRYCPLQQRCIPDTECCDSENFHYCPLRQECIPNGECCDPAEVACPTCRPAAECVDSCLGLPAGGEYCTEVVAEGGSTNQPWATRYPTDLALGGFFGQRPGGQTFAQAKSSQTTARTDDDPATAEYPLVGKVALSGTGSCQAQICDHGQECALYVTTGGRTTAACVDTICDICDPDSSCYDPDQCDCNEAVDPLVCCQDKEALTGVPSPDCILAPRGVAIEVLPNLINRGGSCYVLWATQGMASTTVAGDGMDSGANLELRHLSAGIAEVTNVQASTLFKIVGLGFDGQTYEATDLCATNPVIGEI